MRPLLRPALVLFVLFSVLTGLVYPVAIAAVARLTLPVQAQSSLLLDGDRVVASALVGQPFRSPGYFWGRPSATLPFADNAAASTGSNHGPTNPVLRAAVASRIEALREADPGNTAPVPVDLVTASGSGLDPHISPAAALHQVSRVARARGLDAAAVRTLVESHVEPRSFGVLGEPRVNVLLLNLALDQIAASGP